MSTRLELQRRIDELLRESADDPPTRFSAYRDAAKDVADHLWSMASEGPDAEEAVARALDRAGELAVGPDLARVRHALDIVATNHPRFHELGLRVPPLVQRAPHLTLPKGGKHR